MLGFFYFQLFVCPPDVKRTIFFRGFSLWTPTKAPPLNCCGALIIFHESEHSKLNLSSKMDISESAWINAHQGIIQKKYGFIGFWQSQKWKPKMIAARGLGVIVWVNIGYKFSAIIVITLNNIILTFSTIISLSLQNR